MTANKTPEEHMRLLHLHEVQRMIGLGKTCIYEMMATGEFPRPLRVSRGGVRWKLSDIKCWIESRPVAGPRTE